MFFLRVVVRPSNHSGSSANNPEAESFSSHHLKLLHSRDQNFAVMVFASSVALLLSKSDRSRSLRTMYWTHAINVICCFLI